MRKWIKSANFAIEGILHAAKHQRHIRCHLYSTALVLTFSYVLGISKIEFLIVALAVIAVLLAELMNTAIESVVDILAPEHHIKARIAKDIAAGAVFTTAFGAAIIGCIVLLPPVRKAFNEGFSIARHSGEEIALSSFILVLIIVVIMKSYFGKGTPLRGGLPSGHAAVAFSAWLAVTYLANSIAASAICLLLAAAIAASRVTSGIHTAREVISGGIIGALITFLLFRLFS